LSNKINIFLADDHPIVRDGLKSILETQDDFQIVGEAGNGKEAVEQLIANPTDILMLDLGMPVMDGIEVIQTLQIKKNPTKIIVFTVFDTDERIISAIKAGAKGYLLKGASHEEIFNAVRLVNRGESLLQPVITSKLFKHLHNDSAALTARELDVLKLLADGKKNSVIAQELFIAERTVKFHLSAIFQKLHAKNRTEAVQLALKKGIISI